MNVQDLIDQQAARHQQTSNHVESNGESLENSRGDKGIDPLFITLHEKGTVRFSNGIQISSF